MEQVMRQPDDEPGETAVTAGLPLYATAGEANEHLGSAVAVLLQKQNVSPAAEEAVFVGYTGQQGLSDFMTQAQSEAIEDELDVDMEQLSRQVYQAVKRRLSVEWERGRARL